ncbi:1-phosphofructokinase [Piscibacillus halophilus]|uniref:1-phosphofructokinase n=1 Tax=Piscibacillus halophilus TaxID=571933 RepID=UPI00240A018F|nr:1-phosphofructokinase [Piscibacillus halophilus]
MTVLTLTLNPAIDKTIRLPSFEVGRLNRLTETPREDAGGKGINVAKVLNQLKTSVTTTGFIAGKTGEKLNLDLQRNGISTDFIQVDGEVRTNLKIVDQKHNVTTEINEPGFIVTKKDENELNEKLDHLLKNTTYLVLGGSTPKGIDESVYYRLIQKASDTHVKTILDASGVGLKEGLRAKPFAIKPNIDELEHLFGTTFKSYEEISKACQQLIEEYDVELVVASLGKDGAIFTTKKECLHTQPFKTEVESTVGAGDSMVGAMIYSMLHDFNLEKLAKWATAAGTITASKPGTEVCRLEEIEQTYEKIVFKNFSKSKVLGEE